jgi:hypothetical protein
MGTDKLLGQRRLAMTLRYGVILVCLLSLLSCASGAGAWTQDHIIVTFWCEPPATDEALAAVAAEHYTTTWVPEAGLDAAAAHGLRAMLRSSLLTPAALDDPATKAQLDALIDRVKNHPALEAYYICDEPSANAFPDLGRLVAYLGERDPAHFAYINLFPVLATRDQLGIDDEPIARYGEYLRQYVEIVKPALISYDHYQLCQAGELPFDLPYYFLNLEMIRQAALDAGVPFLNIVQASTVEWYWRLPNANELRYLVYTTLAYGGRGISYFLYWGTAAQGGLYQDGAQTPLAAAAAQLNAEINALSAPLMELDSLGVYHTAPLPPGTKPIPADAPWSIVGPGEFVVGVFGTSGEATALMVVNRSYTQSATAELRLWPKWLPPRRRSWAGLEPPLDRRCLEEFDRTDGVWRSYPCARSGRTYIASIDLAPGDGRLFRLAR